MFEPSRSSSGSTEFASVPVSLVGHDITGLSVVTRPGATVRGRVLWDGDSPRASSVLNIGTENAGVPGAGVISSRIANNGAVNERGDFQIAGVHGTVVFRPWFGERSDGWNLKSVRLAGTEITDTGYSVSTDLDGLEIVMTDRQTTVSGTVKDVQSRP